MLAPFCRLALWSLDCTAWLLVALLLLSRHYYLSVSVYAGTILQVCVVDCAACWLVVLLLLSQPSSVSVCCCHCGLYCLGVGGVAVIVTSLPSSVSLYVVCWLVVGVADVVTSLPSSVSLYMVYWLVVGVAVVVTYFIGLCVP